jgi:hypothetical protein
MLQYHSMKDHEITEAMDLLTESKHVNSLCRVTTLEGIRPGSDDKVTITIRDFGEEHFTPRRYFANVNAEDGQSIAQGTGDTVAVAILSLVRELDRQKAPVIKESRTP